MASKPTFEHRHFKAIAAVIASLPQPQPNDLAALFANALQDTNPNFNRQRFISACSGTPCNGRDKVRS